ncbi:MAG: hypothetical protein P8R54_13640, partial [Myxococcota bacterium]|nr:hypothetical protein [Myxococcota bacterium]
RNVPPMTLASIRVRAQRDLRWLGACRGQVRGTAHPKKGPSVAQQEHCIAVMRQRAGWALAERPERRSPRRAPARCRPGQPELRLPIRSVEHDAAITSSSPEPWSLDTGPPMPWHDPEPISLASRLAELDNPPLPRVEDVVTERVYLVQVPAPPPPLPTPDPETLWAGIGLGLSLVVAARAVKP